MKPLPKHITQAMILRTKRTLRERSHLNSRDERVLDQANNVALVGGELDAKTLTRLQFLILTASTI